ncbi:hypothetical protein P7C71_g2615, partial [Lecanoromycetidae sp. Uapishka_2]
MKTIPESQSRSDREWSLPQDMAAWNVISDLTYGQPFNLLTSSNLRWLVKAIVSGNRRIYLRFAWPALFNVRPSAWYNPDKWIFPEMAAERQRFLEISTKYSEERMASEEKMGNRNDIMSALLAAEDPKTKTKLSQAEVWGEAHLMIAAGGDTTSTALASVLFYLSRNDAAHARLNHEIRSTFRSVETIRQGRLLNSCKYLRACLEEAMRLAPPAPGALWREVCHGGAVVDEQQIPAGYDVAVCQYAICHNAEYFPDPYVFNPERFIVSSSKEKPGDDYFSHVSTSKSSPYLSPSALSPSISTPFPFTPSVSSPLPRTPGGTEKPPSFAPFLIGPRSCVAKPFAYLEMSLAIARLVWLMDFRTADRTGEGKPHCGIVGRERNEEFQIVDMFSSSKEGPVLQWRKRERDW